MAVFVDLVGPDNGVRAYKYVLADDHQAAKHGSGIHKGSFVHHRIIAAGIFSKHRTCLLVERG
jgi:hypothetical protein